MKEEAPREGELQKLMDAASLGQTEVAAYVGVSQPTVSKWALGDRRMPPAAWLVLRADIALDNFGVQRWPPPSFDVLMRWFAEGVTRHDLGVPLITGRRDG